MSSNGSIGSDTTNATVVYTYSSSLPDIYYIYCGIAIFVIIVGTLLNSWFLAAILSSQDTRSRLRNKIICNSLVLHLVDSVILLPINVWRLLNRHIFNCAFFSVVRHLTLIQDFIGNWLLVMLLVVFISQIQDFNPKLKLSPRATTIGTVGLMVFPWVASLVLVPVIVHEYHRRQPYRGYCMYPSLDATEVFKFVDTAVPICLAILLLIVAVFLRYRRFTRGFSSRSMQTELISRGPEIDNSIAYIAGTAVCVICDLFLMIFITNIRTFFAYGYNILSIMDGVAAILSSSRVILMPLPWILLPDIRQRIKTWRPWYRPAPGIDLTMTYRKEEVEEV